VLAEALDAALHRDRQRERAQAVNPSKEQGQQGQAAATPQQQYYSAKAPVLAVANVELVQRFDFYGFHETPKAFWRISLYSPGLVRRAADLLQEGAVDGVRYQPYEAHVPFLLQFFTDYNLQGMNFVHAAKASFREPLPSGAATAALASGKAEGGGRHSLPALDAAPDSMPAATRTFHEGNVPGRQRRDLEGRYSSCELEIDFHVGDILNGTGVEAGAMGAPSPARGAAKGGGGGAGGGVRYPANPGLAALWEDERERRRQRGEPATFTPSAGVERVAVDEASLTANERFWREQLALAVEADKLLPDLRRARKEAADAADAAGAAGTADAADAADAAASAAGHAPQTPLDQQTSASSFAAHGAVSPTATPDTSAAIKALLDVYDSQIQDSEVAPARCTQATAGAIETLLDVYDSQLRGGEDDVQERDAEDESEDEMMETQRMTQVRAKD
jgi:hypothetical protein